LHPAVKAITIATADVLIRFFVEFFMVCILLSVSY